jgi:hypothetical protein
MSQDDITRIHERLDEIIQNQAKLQTAVDVNVALCQQCRPKVMGNGKDGYDTRIARLEATKETSSWFIGKIIAVAGVVATVAGVATTIIVKLVAG